MNRSPITKYDSPQESSGKGISWSMLLTLLILAMLLAVGLAYLLAFPFFHQHRQSSSTGSLDDQNWNAVIHRVRTGTLAAYQAIALRLQPASASRTNHHFEQIGPSLFAHLSSVEPV